MYDNFFEWIAQAIQTDDSLKCQRIAQATWMDDNFFLNG